MQTKHVFPAVSSEGTGFPIFFFSLLKINLKVGVFYPGLIGTHKLHPCGIKTSEDKMLQTEHEAKSALTFVSI